MIQERENIKKTIKTNLILSFDCCCCFKYESGGEQNISSSSWHEDLPTTERGEYDALQTLASWSWLPTWWFLTKLLRWSFFYDCSCGS